MAPKLKIKLSTKDSSDEPPPMTQPKKHKREKSTSSKTTPKIKLRTSSASGLPSIHFKPPSSKHDTPSSPATSTSTPTLKIMKPKSKKTSPSTSRRSSSMLSSSSLPAAVDSTISINTNSDSNISKDAISGSISASSGGNLLTLNLKKPKRVPTIRVKPTRIPGDGYDSEDPDKEDDPLIEEGIILRMLPPDPNNADVSASLDQLRQSAEAGDFNGISLKWKDKKRAILKINGVLYGGKLVDLPTVVEVFKSVDRKNMYKTIDVCQILIITCKLQHERDVVSAVPVDYEFGETFPHGLSCPMENAKDRFQKKYKEAVVQNVEDEVDRLLKMDDEAESSSYEFIDASMLDSAGVGGSFITSGAGLGKKKRKKKVKKERRLSVSSSGVDGGSSGINNTSELSSSLGVPPSSAGLLANATNGGTSSQTNAEHDDFDDMFEQLMEEEEGEDEDDDEDDEEEEEEDTTTQQQPVQIDQTTKLAKDEEDVPASDDEEEVVEGAPVEGEDNNNATSEDDDDDDEDDDDEDDEEEGQDINTLKRTAETSTGSGSGANNGSSSTSGGGAGGAGSGTGSGSGGAGSDEMDETEQHNARVREEIAELEAT
ncbi:unnamed protein product [Ambrosiozyma monospora]|uniref:Unnamed protein product n=1 Tax=Ambrosiozyma monospora TaxID=43982 RepID=A0ACB5T1A9_AMBMO|nr:unnamed protein product [Ambrosiozyma monospora]